MITSMKVSYESYHCPIILKNAQEEGILQLYNSIEVVEYDVPVPGMWYVFGLWKFTLCAEYFGCANDTTELIYVNITYTSTEICRTSEDSGFESPA